MAEILHSDGRVELDPAERAEIASSPLCNDDLAPVPMPERNWTTYNYAALWISMAHCIPTYMMAAGLIDAGMSWRQALFTILLGNIIVLAPILANSHPGTKYGIPFPVFARAAYGTAGSNLPALMRAIVACGWFGIQCWIGGKALHTFLCALWPGWHVLLGGSIQDIWVLTSFKPTTPTMFIDFMIFWGLNILIVFRGMNLLRKVENWAAPFVLIMTSFLVGWAVWRAHGLGNIMAQPGRLQTFGAFMPVFAPSLTAMIGFWATLSLNMPDFTRYGRSQRDQIVGQVVALPSTMTVFAAMGVVITSATAIIYGERIWDPIDLVGKFSDRAVVAVAMFTIAVATVSVNIAANVVSPANDFANAFPRLINFRRGGVLTGVIGIAMLPWKLADDPSKYIYKWLVGYSGGLGSIAGVLIADYFFVRRRKLDLADLYRTDGQYAGWNMNAVAATLVGCAAAWVGVVVPLLRPVFDYAWFVGLLVAGGLHFALARRKAHS